jgi:hypothetical protein
MVVDDAPDGGGRGRANGHPAPPDTVATSRFALMRELARQAAAESRAAAARNESDAREAEGRGDVRHAEVLRGFAARQARNAELLEYAV